MQVGLNLKGNYYLRKILSNISLKISYLSEDSSVSHRILQNPQTPMIQPQTLTLKESNEGDNKPPSVLLVTNPCLINSYQHSPSPSDWQSHANSPEVSNH